MNISAVSFAGNYKSSYTQSFGRNSQRYNDTSYKDEFTHSKIISPRYPHKEEHNNKSLIPIPIATAGIGAACVLMLTFGSPATAEPCKTIPFNGNENSIILIAQENNCDLDFLLEYNNINEDTDYNTISEINVPSSYSYLQDEIDKIAEKLDSSKLSDKKRIELEEELSALQAKQNEQNQVAEVYTDGKYVFFNINISEDYSNDKYKYGINVETLKKLFDIEDGAIRKHNDLDVRWESYANGEGSYMDYTYNWFHNGDIIKVPVSAIQVKDINLSQYLGE